MHLWAGDSYVNSALHSNYFYGYVDTTKEYTDGKDKYAYDKGNLMGLSKTLGGTVKVFEPQNSDKGDIARAVFYMVARYNNLAGDDSTIENDNPNLELVNDLSAWVESGYISTSTKTGKLGILSDLLEWNKLDPVDNYEIKRNDILYKNYTNNRNPFIDFPEWADMIWGKDAYSKSANPQTDEIHQNSSSTPDEPSDEPATNPDDNPSSDDQSQQEEKQAPVIDTKIIVIVGIVALVIIVLIVIIIAKFGSKKQKKAVKKIVKKGIKSTKKNSKGKK